MPEPPREACGQCKTERGLQRRWNAMRRYHAVREALINSMGDVVEAWAKNSDKDLACRSY
jgi:hypothetical protein